MGALKDIADGIAAAGPVAMENRRFIVVGTSAGPAVASELRLAIGRPLQPGQTWRDALVDAAGSPRSSLAFIPTDDFAGWTIVDRPVQ